MGIAYGAQADCTASSSINCPTLTVQTECIPGTAATRIGGNKCTKFNVSIGISPANPQLENCTIVAYSTLTGNSSATDYANGTLGGLTAIWSGQQPNSTNTHNFTKWNFTMRVNDLEDANNYVFKAICNTTGGYNRYVSGTATGITIDHTRPNAATLTAPAEATTDTTGDITFTGTVADKNTTSCSLVFSSEGPTPSLSSYAMDYSTTSCSLTTRLPMGSGYKWAIAAFDTQNTTISGYRTLSVRTQGNLPQKALYLQSIGAMDGSSSGLIWIALIVGALYFFGKKKKK